MNDITEPLRLAVGSHSAGSGKGCAMNLISWENGDTTITDLPGCSDPMLARIVQRINDSICTHRDGDLLIGTLRNDPVFVFKGYGDTVKFHIDDIIDCSYDEEAEQVA